MASGTIMNVFNKTLLMMHFKLKQNTSSAELTRREGTATAHRETAKRRWIAFCSRSRSAGVIFVVVDVGFEVEKEVDLLREFMSMLSLKRRQGRVCTAAETSAAWSVLRHLEKLT